MNLELTYKFFGFDVPYPHLRINASSYKIFVVNNLEAVYNRHFIQKDFRDTALCGVVDEQETVGSSDDDSLLV